MIKDKAHSHASKSKGEDIERAGQRKEGNFDRLSTNRSNQLNQSPTEDLSMLSNPNAKQFSLIHKQRIWRVKYLNSNYCC